MGLLEIAIVFGLAVSHNKREREIERERERTRGGLKQLSLDWLYGKIRERER